MNKKPVNVFFCCFIDKTILRQFSELLHDNSELWGEIMMAFISAQHLSSSQKLCLLLNLQAVT